MVISRSVPSGNKYHVEDRRPECINTQPRLLGMERLNPTPYVGSMSCYLNGDFGILYTVILQI